MTIVLFADNDTDFLQTWSEYLEREGYHVIPATTVVETRELLLQGRVDLAILDIRLERDKDEKDKSGLNLAREVALAVPKIILTGFPNVQAVREALGPALNELPVAVDFIDKNDGPKALVKAVKKALAAFPSFVQDVFIVHGHDEAARETVARFIEHLGLRPIILRDLPSSGRTIIAQIERYSRVGFVIVLLTPDDMGYPKSQPQQRKYRARQNVIFELGFFIGRLGPAQVCLLYKEGVEIPSDYQGVLYIPMDSQGGWKIRLAQELDAASITFDHERIIEA
jgi:predicted nucleotide-binding protein